MRRTMSQANRPTPILGSPTAPNTPLAKPAAAETIDYAGRRPSDGKPASPGPRKKSPWMVYLILLLGSLAFLTPFYFVLNGSLKTDAEVQAGDFVSPTHTPRWENYRGAVDRLGLRMEES